MNRLQTQSHKVKETILMAGKVKKNSNNVLLFK